MRLEQVRAAAVTVLLSSGLLLRAAAGQADQADPGASTASSAVNRTYFNQDIFIPRGQAIHDATCVFCSVQVEGDVGGGVLVLFGNLSVTGRIDGTVTVVGGNAVFDAQARVLQRTAVLFGNLVYETEDVLSSSAYVLGGHSSSYGARQGMRRRFALSPGLVSTLALLGFLLLLTAAAMGFRHRRHPG